MEEDDLGIIQSGSFYYSPDKMIHSIDNSFVIAQISAKYPDLEENNKESIIKQVLVAIFSDDKLVTEVLEYFDIDILDLFKIIYNKYSFIFSACFVNKLQVLIKKKKYDK